MYPYTGEKIGLYFAFTGHYTTWLVPLCMASIAVILYFLVLYAMEGTLIDALNEGVMVPFFCIFVAVWAQLMLEYWKREQNRYTLCVYCMLCTTMCACVSELMSLLPVSFSNVVQMLLLLQ